MKKCGFIVIVMACLISAVMADDSPVKTLEIKGAKIASEQEAKKVALHNYVKKMQLNILAEEGVDDISIIKLGFDVKGFASKGDKIWEVHVATDGDELRAIIWVNSKTGDAYLVVGPWIAKEKEDGKGK
jgi:hypothetical protein